jgi:hypothetical protein
MVAWPTTVRDDIASNAVVVPLAAVMPRLPNSVVVVNLVAAAISSPRVDDAGENSCPKVSIFFRKYKKFQILKKY